MEMFGPTIQGEGRRAGHISYFIRFGGCNFRCSGFGVEYTDPDGNVKYGCDSYYSVDPKFKKNWSFLSYTEIIESFNELLKPSSDAVTKPDIVITGGEPTMYWNNEDFQKFLIYYISRGHKITIETNASLDIEFDKDYQKEIIFSMSVKLKNSGEPEHKRINVKNITNILENTKKSYFKFVISKENIVETEIEILELLKEIPYYTDVYLMPMGETNEVLNENSLATAEMAIKNNWQYTDRLHIRLWDNKMGV